MGTIALNVTGFGTPHLIAGSSAPTNITVLTGNVNQTFPPGFQSAPFFTSLPEQMIGFMPLTDCSYIDCRDSELCGYVSPVFGDVGVRGASYTNDVSGFYVNWTNYV